MAIDTQSTCGNLYIVMLCLKWKLVCNRTTSQLFWIGQTIYPLMWEEKQFLERYGVSSDG